MSEAGRQAALRTMSGARAAVARLDASRDPEDVAAELVEVWATIETALRGLVGGSPLGGQDLVREVRRRELLTLTQAHALLDFLTVRERLNDTAYKPTEADVKGAREAVTQLEGALAAPAPEAAPEAPPAVLPPPPSSATPPRRDEPAGQTPRERSGPRFARTRQNLAAFPVWGWILVALLAIGFAAGATWFVTRGAGDDLADGRRLLREGRREAARGEFERVARENPRAAEAHIFLARMAREEGDLPRAREHAATAIRAEPNNGLAHREMGIILYTMGSYDLARPFLERAIRFRPADNAAQGMMGCTLVRIGQRELGVRFISRAGPGPWSDCAR